jgi:hypothetical protein
MIFDLFSKSIFFAFLLLYERCPQDLLLMSDKLQLLIELNVGQGRVCTTAKWRAYNRGCASRYTPSAAPTFLLRAPPRDPYTQTYVGSDRKLTHL